MAQYRDGAALRPRRRRQGRHGRLQRRLGQRRTTSRPRPRSTTPTPGSPASTALTAPDEPAPVARGRAARRTPWAGGPRAGCPAGRRLQRRRRLPRARLGHGLRGPRARAGTSSARPSTTACRRARPSGPTRVVAQLAALGRRRDGQRPRDGRGARARARGGRPGRAATPCSTRSASASRPRRCCSATPATTRPRPCCSAWPAARAAARSPGCGAAFDALPPAAARRRRTPTPSPRARSRASRCWDDPHNVDPAFTRVRVRRRVLPVLEDELGPGVTEALARTADQLRADMDLLDAYAERGARRVVRRRRPVRSRRWPGCRARSGPGCCGRPRSPRARPPARLFHQHVLAVDALVTDWHGQKWVDLPGHLRAVRRDGVLRFERAEHTD